MQLRGNQCLNSSDRRRYIAEHAGPGDMHMDGPILQVKEFGIECAEPLHGHETSPEPSPGDTPSTDDSTVLRHRARGAPSRITPRAATSSTQTRGVRLVVGGMVEALGHRTIVE